MKKRLFYKNSNIKQTPAAVAGVPEAITQVAAEGGSSRLVKPAMVLVKTGPLVKSSTLVAAAVEPISAKVKTINKCECRKQWMD